MSFGEDEGYRDSFEQPPIRTCERCGTGGDELKPNPMCGEVQLAFGLVTWICYDCRKDWHRMFKSHKLQATYSEATLRLEFWKARIGETTSKEEIDEGIKLLKTVDNLELQVNEVANAWLIGDLDEVRSI
jgi:hypothetical protein